MPYLKIVAFSDLRWHVEQHKPVQSTDFVIEAADLTSQGEGTAVTLSWSRTTMTIRKTFEELLKTDL